MSNDHSGSSFKQDLLKTLPALRAFALSLCGRHDKADDLVQDAVVKALLKRELFVPGTNLKAWVFTILRNEYFSQLRKKAVRLKIRMEL